MNPLLSKLGLGSAQFVPGASMPARGRTRAADCFGTTSLCAPGPRFRRSDAGAASPAAPPALGKGLFFDSSTSRSRVAVIVSSPFAGGFSPNAGRLSRNLSRLSNETTRSSGKCKIFGDKVAFRRTFVTHCFVGESPAHTESLHDATARDVVVTGGDTPRSAGQTQGDDVGARAPFGSSITRGNTT